ncbi:periplasmic Cu(I)/Cu(II)-binding protein CopK [Aquabacterium sp.]|uniref:periplasmic Cu(I)/Cu(II)-binding protein CopK n=1 Tax=Aquabacterium sp. TaxID=1872578 RepID=UPI004037C13B
MLKKILAIAAMITVAGAASAVDMSQVEKKIDLKDGSTIYIFKDGKMGMEDKLGRPAYMQPGTAMETKDGKRIIMNGNEVWRVDELLHQGHKG